MAKFLSGAAVASVSGSVGGTVFSRNRYGQYMRMRAIPVQPNTVWQEEQRGIVAGVSQAYKHLTRAGREAWATWAQNNPFVDRLGQTQILSGHAAFVRLNVRIIRMGGGGIETPPVEGPPEPLANPTLAIDLAQDKVNLTWTNTPLGSGQHLIVWAAVVNSGGIKYVRNLEKQVLVAPAQTASPRNLYANLVERFGTLQNGQVLAVRVGVGSDRTGLYSSLRSLRGVLSST